MTSRVAIGGSLAALALSALLIFGPARAFGLLPQGSAVTRDQAGNRPLAVLVRPMRREVGYTRHQAYTGTVRAARTGLLAFEAPGKLIEVLVDDGDRIEAGDVLARQDDRKLRARRDEIEARLKEAQAAFAEAQNGPRLQTVEAARARVAELQAQEALAEIEFRRDSELRQTGSVPQQSLDRTRFSYEAARARRMQAEQELSELDAGTRPERLDAAAAAVAQLEASLEDLDLRIEDCRLVAPYAGRVVRRMADEGAIVAADVPVLEIAETDRLEVRLGLPPEIATELVDGSDCRLTIAGREYAARVLQRLPRLDPQTRTQTVLLTLHPDPNGAVEPPLSELARLTIELPVAREGFWVPLSAMTRGPRGLWSLFVTEGTEGGEHRVVRVEVELLHADDDRAFVRGPIDDGTSLIVDGPHRVVPGQRIEPLAEATAAAESATSDAAGAGSIAKDDRMSPR